VVAEPIVTRAARLVVERADARLEFPERHAVDHGVIMRTTV
jgi:hypothetical protein